MRSLSWLLALGSHCRGAGCRRAYIYPSVATRRPDGSLTRRIIDTALRMWARSCLAGKHRQRWSERREAVLDSTRRGHGLVAAAAATCPEAGAALRVRDGSTATAATRSLTRTRARAGVPGEVVERGRRRPSPAGRGVADHLRRGSLSRQGRSSGSWTSSAPVGGSGTAASGGAGLARRHRPHLFPSTISRGPVSVTARHRHGRTSRSARSRCTGRRSSRCRPQR
jgi:hypothetical protein